MHWVQDTDFLVRVKQHSGNFYNFINFNHIQDTATMYGNEKELGIAIKELLPKYNLSRKDIFVTTKLCKYNFYMFFLCINLLNFDFLLWILLLIAFNPLISCQNGNLVVLNISEDIIFHMENTR